MSYSIKTLSDYSNISDFLKEANMQKEQLILAQLNNLVSRGLLVVKEGPMVLARSVDSATFELKQLIELELKDQEYIKKLEGQVKDLETRLNSIQTALQNTQNVEDTGHWGP